MSAITDEAVEAKARELHDTSSCERDDCAMGPGSTLFELARAVLVDEQRKADAERERAQVAAELRDRIDHAREVGVDFEAVLRTVAHAQPDAVRYALDEAGAPS